MRHRPVRATSARAGVFAGVVISIGVGVLVPGAAAGAAAPAPRQESSAHAVQLHVAEQDFAVAGGESWRARLGVVDPDGVLDDAVPASTSTPSPPGTSITADTDTDTDTAPTAPATVLDGRVTVALRGRIDDRGELERVREGELNLMTDMVELPLDRVLERDQRGSAVVDVAVPITARAQPGTLAARRPGIYPVTVTLHVGADEVAETTTLLQVLPEEPTGHPSLGIAIAAALSEPGPDPEAGARATARAELEELIAFGDQTDAALSVAFPPSLADLLADDEDLRASTRQALEHAELLALPYLTLDPSAAVRVDRADAFSAEVRRGEDALSRTLPGAASRRAAWLAQEPLSRGAAAMLRDPLGYRLLVVDHQTYESLPGNIGTFLDPSLAVDIDLGDGATMQGAVVSPLGALLGGGPPAGPTPTETAVDLLARLLVNRDELGAEQRRNVVLATAGFGVPDGATVAALDQLLDGNPDAHLTTLSELVGTTDTMIVGSDPLTLALPAEAGVDLSERVQRLDLVRVSAESAASMLTDDGQRREWLSEIDALLSTGYSDEQVTAEIERLTGEIVTVRTSVEPPEPFTFTLTGRDSTLRLNLRNNAAEPRNVIVRAVSNKLRFPDGDQELTLQPGVNEVEIPVEARANGTSSVEIQLLTPVFGQRIGASTFLEARVNAISGLGQTITGIAIVLLVTWWYSHFRRKRRARLAAMVVVDDYDPGPSVSPDAAEAAVGAPAGTSAATGSLPDP